MGTKLRDFAAESAADEAGGGKVGDCGHPLGPRVDGEHRMFDDQTLCEDCYSDAISDGIEKNPPRRGLTRGGAH